MTTESHDYARVHLKATQHAKAEVRTEISVEVLYTGSDDAIQEAALQAALNLHDDARAALAQRYDPEALVDQALDSSLRESLKQQGVEVDAEGFPKCMICGEPAHKPHDIDKHPPEVKP